MFVKLWGAGVMDFKNTRLSLRRPLTDYSKVQGLVSRFRRGSRWQTLVGRKGLRRANIGCGPNGMKEFLNIDYDWRPGIDLCWDITRGLPLETESLDGVFTEHCLEHLTLDDCRKLLADLHRILVPSGTLRIVVPDAQIYMETYSKRLRGECASFPYEAEDVQDHFTPMMAVNRVFRDHGHQYAYDYETLAMLLSQAGYVDVTKDSFRSGRDPALLVDCAHREVESLYVEASKAGALR